MGQNLEGDKRVTPTTRKSFSFREATSWADLEGPGRGAVCAATQTRTIVSDDRVCPLVAADHVATRRTVPVLGSGVQSKGSLLFEGKAPSCNVATNFPGRAEVPFSSLSTPCRAQDLRHHACMPCWVSSGLQRMPLLQRATCRGTAKHGTFCTLTTRLRLQCLGDRNSGCILCGAGYVSRRTALHGVRNLWPGF